MAIARSVDRRRGNFNSSNRGRLNAVKREANVPRELYRTWLWRGPAAVVNRTGKASLTVRDVPSADGHTDARLSLRLRIKKGSERPSWLYYDRASAVLYMHQVPRILYPERGIQFRLDPVPDTVLLESKGQFDADLAFTPVVPFPLSSLLRGSKFRVLVSGLDLELDGAGTRELWPVFIWGECE